MALGGLLNGIDAPLWLCGVFMLVLNGVILAHVVGGPVGDKIADAVIWSVVLAAAVGVIRNIAFRRVRWRTVSEWTGVALVVINLVGAAILRLAA